MLYIFCPRASMGAKELTAALGAQRLRNFDGLNFWNKKYKVKVKPGDFIVCWGECLPEIDGVKILNGGKILNKFHENTALKAAKVPTIEVVSSVPPGAREGWLPRRNNHVGGNDLLHRPLKADFWSKKLDIVNEYRVHSFAGKSIRAGKKVPRVAQPHAWIRSYDGGWKIDYDAFKSNEGQRKVARNAVKALGLTFGAVDLAELKDQNIIVLEVNRAPGLEGNTITKYVEAIQKWVAAPDAPHEVEDAPTPFKKKKGLHQI